jgi:hypothetical protein
MSEYEGHFGRPTWWNQGYYEEWYGKPGRSFGKLTPGKCGKVLSQNLEKSTMLHEFAALLRHPFTLFLLRTLLTQVRSNHAPMKGHQICCTLRGHSFCC